MTLTEAAKNYLLHQPIYKNIIVDVIPCCADLDHFDYRKISPIDINELKNKLNIPREAKVITYSGSVGGWYMTKEMFHFFNTVLQQYPEYIMLILTKDDPDKVKEEAVTNGILPGKVIVTYVERSKMPLYLSVSDFSVFFIRNTFSKIASSPTKHAELMGMGIPVICNDIGDTGYIISETNTGCVINSFEKEQFENIVGRLTELEGLDKQRIRDSAFHFFDLHAGVKKYAAFYNKLLHYNSEPDQLLHEST